MKQEYKIEAFKDTFDGEKTDVFARHIIMEEKELKKYVFDFVKYHSAEKFNVWMKVEV